MPITWKIAAASGAAIGLGVGGFALTSQADDNSQPVRDVDLQSANESISSLSSPIEVTTTLAPTTTMAPPPVEDSPDSPVEAPAPAPAVDDSVSADSPVQPAPSGSDDSASAASAASADSDD